MASPHVARTRRTREQSITKWRRETAKQRSVDEQVVLPGHCLQDLADLDNATPEQVASVIVFLASPGASFMTGALVPVYQALTAELLPILTHTTKTEKW